MKVVHLSNSDINGGAAKAVYRISNALRDVGIESFMWVNFALAGDWTVDVLSNDKIRKLTSIVKPHLAKLLTNTLSTHSFDSFSFYL